MGLDMTDMTQWDWMDMTCIFIFTEMFAILADQLKEDRESKIGTDRLGFASAGS
jgi:hypothetical protein